MFINEHSAGAGPDLGNPRSSSGPGLRRAGRRQGGDRDRRHRRGAGPRRMDRRAL